MTRRHGPDEFRDFYEPEDAEPQERGAPPHGEIILPEAPATFKTAKKFCDEYTPLSYAVEPFVRSSSLYTLTAKTGSGKTALLIITALAVATGRSDILGREVTRGRVAYIAAENPDDLRMRIKVAADLFKIDLAELGDNLVILDKRVKPEELEATLRELSKERTFTLVMIDTLAAFFDGNDLNDNVQGGEFITESLSEYSALMVLKQKYGDAKMHRFLKYELDRYLLGRGSEQKTERPLVRADGAAYVHYQKGALALYALQDAIGEPAINDALAAFVTRWRFAGPPYARSVDLLAEFRRVTPAAQHPLIVDLFETITLYDVRAVSASSKKLADGRFSVDVLVTAKKVRADGAGNETEVPFDGMADIGALDAAGNVLGIEKRVVKSGENRFTLTLAKDPAKAGIDPLGKLIDRDANDNVVAVTR